MNYQPSTKQTSKFVVVTVCFSLLTNQVLFAHLPQTSLWDERQKALQLARTPLYSERQNIQASHTFSPLPSSGVWPTQFGVIRDAYTGKSKEPLLIIQDIHLNAEAQQNEIKMLKYLSEKGMLRSIAVEGASGDFDFRPFFEAGDQTIRRDVANAFLKSNRIAAVSYFGVTAADLNTRVVGIDDDALYEKNVQAYLKSEKKQKALTEDLAKETEVLLDAKRKTFNPALFQLDQKVAAYQSGSLSLGGLLETLKPEAAVLKQFMEAYRLEKNIDFNRADRERRQILERLVAKLNQNDVEKLMQMSLANHEGRLRSADYYGYLTAVFKKHGISLAQAPAFGAYLRYIALSDGIDAGLLIASVEKTIKSSLLALTQTDEERQLLVRSRQVHLQSRLVKFEMTPEEWKEYSTTPDVMPTFSDFYRFADARSERLVENLIEKVLGTSYLVLRDNKVLSPSTKYKVPSTPLNVLIIGGFHTPEITRQLKEKGVSFVVMSPNVTKIEEGSGSAYLSVFSREKTPIEKLFEGKKLTILPNQVLLGSSGAQSANGEMKVIERLVTAQRSKVVRQDNGLLVWSEAGNVFMAVPAGAKIPKGYAPTGAIIPVDGTPLQMVLPTTPNKEDILDWWENQLRRFAPAAIVLILTPALFLLPMNPVYVGIFALMVFVASPTMTTMFSSSSKGSTWLEENTPGLKGKKILEVTMEMALSGEVLKALEEQGLTPEQMRAVAMASSTGGIGPLLKERVIEQSILGADVIGVSLLYDYVWVQKITKSLDANQPDKIHQEKVFVGDLLRKVFKRVGSMELEMHDGSLITTTIWRAPPGMYGSAPVYFLHHPSITNVAYPGKADFPDPNEPFNSRIRRDYEQDQRLAQNWLVGRGSLATVEFLNIESRLEWAPDLIVMSEMPTVFAHPRMFRDRFTHHPLFKRTKTVFNDHTPLEYAHPKWTHENLHEMKLDPRYFTGLPVWINNQEVDGTAMTINAVDAVYGVAKKHGEVMRRMPLLRQFSRKIQWITNGVSSVYWPVGLFARLEKVRELSDEQILKIRNEKRVELMSFLQERNGLKPDELEDKPIVIWTRRIVKYKRMDLFAEMLESDRMRDAFIKTGIVFVVGGRIHQDDPFGLQQFDRIQRAMVKDQRLRSRVVFFHDHNIWEAPHLFQGASASVMLADDGREASATGFQKAQMNGALIIASADGAVPESVHFYRHDQNNQGSNGFEVPYDHNGSPTAEGLLWALQEFSSVYRDKHRYALMVRNALEETSRVSVERTAQDMLRFFENVLHSNEAVENQYKEGRDIARRYLSRQTLSENLRENLVARVRESGRFEWKYKEFGKEEVTLKISLPGLKGFIESFRYIRTLGTVGEWSLAFHAANNGGVGDFAIYLSSLLRGSIELEGLRREILDLGEAARHSKDPLEILALNRKILGIAEGMFSYLESAVSNHPYQGQHTFGLMGFWNQIGDNVSVKKKTIFESALILSVAMALVAWFIFSIGIPIPAELHHVDFLQTSAQISFFTSLILFPLLVILHRLFGVAVYSDEKWISVHEWGIALRASLVASIGLLGLPFITYGLLTGGWGLPLVFLGVVIPTWGHVFLNSRALEFQKLNTPRAIAQEIARLTDVRSSGLKDYSPERDRMLGFTLRVDTTENVINGKDHVLLVPKSTDPVGLKAEINKARALQAGKLMVFVGQENENRPESLAVLQEFQSNGGKLIYESELKDAASVERSLLGALPVDGKLKLLLRSANGLPDSILRILFDLASKHVYENRIQMILLQELEATALAVEISHVMNMDALLKFLELVGSQA